MLTLNQVRQFWLNCGTATTENLYVGTPLEFVHYGDTTHPMTAAVIRMLREAHDSERSTSA